MIARKVLAEALGASLLTACVVGSGIMAMFELPLIQASNHALAERKAVA